MKHVAKIWPTIAMLFDGLEGLPWALCQAYFNGPVCQLNRGRDLGVIWPLQRCNVASILFNERGGISLYRVGARLGPGEGVIPGCCSRSLKRMKLIA